jgi:hypothetical protein
MPPYGGLNESRTLRVRIIYVVPKLSDFLQKNPTLWAKSVV